MIVINIAVIDDVNVTVAAVVIVITKILVTVLYITVVDVIVYSILTIINTRVEIDITDVIDVSVVIGVTSTLFHVLRNLLNDLGAEQACKNYYDMSTEFMG